jgi:thioredoxin 1
LVFARFDADDVAGPAQELGISNLPAFSSFKEGEKCDCVVGANPSALKNSIQKLHS